MNRVNKNQVFTGMTIVLFIIGLVVIGFVFGEQSENNKILKADTTTENNLKKAKNDYKERLKEVNDGTLEYISKSEDDQVKYVYTYDSLLNKSSEAVNSFFEVFHTWGSLDQYQGRPAKLKDVASQELLDNSNVFDSGLDNTGGDMISALELSSEFKSAETTVVNTDNEATLIVVVRVVTHEGSSIAHKQVAYQMVYNQEEQKITDLKKLTALENV